MSANENKKERKKEIAQGRKEDDEESGDGDGCSGDEGGVADNELQQEQQCFNGRSGNVYVRRFLC